MNSRLIRILIFVMLASLVGLVILQAEYLRDAIEVKENHFNQLVNQSLSEAVQQLESNITKEYFNMEMYGSTNQGSSQLLEEGQQKKDSIGFEFLIDEGIAYLDDTSFCTTNARVAVYSSDSMVFSIENDLGEVESRTYYFGDITHHPSSNQPFGNMHSKQFDYIVGRILSIDQGVERKLNKEELEGAIRQSLDNKGISLEYEYAVLKPRLGYILGSADFEPQTEKDIFRVQLSPEDFFTQPSYLELYFPSKGNFILNSIGVMGISSLILILAIIGLFAISVVIIIRQKKLS